ncbi:MAG TPA: isopentenyl-diphosphate Delta-isomerase [Actinomycetota bacterium]|nr:isopentenyl-diphosphate Delta-isomerase [Actinomycetota bacterium]
MPELVVLLDEDGRAIGTAPKTAVHHRDTPLHLAFSCYAIDAAGRVLLARRAESKATWPGVWSNSCCGHPQPDEPLVRAVRRRLADELGIGEASVDAILPRFRYRAAMPSGVIEYEVCPVFRATLAAGVAPWPNPDEVAETAWVPLTALAARPESDISPWCAAQVPELLALGDDPRAWPAARPADLPFGGDPAYPCSCGTKGLNTSAKRTGD